MGKRKSQRPTEAELEILRVLWERGACTVRDVHEDLNRSREVGYTTVLKLMQIMLEKKLVTRDDSQRSHVYKAALPQNQAQRRLVADLLERAYGGSAEQLVMQALQVKKVSAEELANIRKLLDELER